MENQEGEKKDVRRPMNAFLIFCKRHRSMVREKNPDLDNRSVTKILGDLWANLANEKKLVYTTLAKQYKDAFMKANPDYKWHNPDKIHQPPVKMATRPTNARVLKNEVGINLDGSIVPGKLADPSKMGGLSLLLMAGQQSLPAKPETASQERKDGNLVTSPTDDSPSTSKSALLELAEMCTNELNFEPDQDDDKIHVLKNTEQKSTNVKVKGDEKGKVIHLTQDESQPMDLSTKTGKNSLLEKITLNKQLLKQEVETSNTRNDAQLASKPMIQPEADDTKIKFPQQNPSDQNDNDIIACGKVVVDHIFDRLVSAQIECQLKSKSLEEKNPPRSLDKVKPPGSSGSDVDVTESHIDRVVTEIYKQTEIEPMETSILKTLQEDQERTEQLQREQDEGDHHDDNMDREDSDEKESSGGTKRQSQDYESQNDDDMMPVRKSRRRNRGQRYQELINEGIIQPSKERLAARRAAKTVPDEESDGYEDFMMVEEVVDRRPVRKRMISEGEDGEDLKKYKTGDFDLEAHIADLPACSLDQLSKGGKKNLLRARHLSESSIKKSTSSLTTLKEEVTSCLPPHVRLKSTEQSTEQVVGSRRRKIRKHSITHLIPADSVKNIPLTDASKNQSESTKPSNTEVNEEGSKIKGEDKERDGNGEERRNEDDTRCREMIKSEDVQDVFSNDVVTTGDKVKDTGVNVKDTDEVVASGDIVKVTGETHPDVIDAKTEKNATKFCEFSKPCCDIVSEGQKLVRSFSEPCNAMTSQYEISEASHPISMATTDRLDLPSNVTTSNNTKTVSLDNQDKTSSDKSLDNQNTCAIKYDQPKSSHLNQQKLESFHNSPVEKVNMSASGVRVDIITTEMKSEDSNPSIQCQGTSAITAVHS